MEIRINGKLLDIIPQEVSMSWKSWIFADAIGDQYTTDIELPRTQNNSAILQPFGVLDGLNHFQKRIRCAVSIDFVGCDGYLQISSLKRDTITAALFLSPLPYDLVDRKIRDIIHDTSYIREWDLLSPTSLTSGHASGLQRSFFSNPMGSRVCPWSLRLAEFLSSLSAATGVTLNFPFTDVFRVVASVPKVSPYNTRQAVYTYTDTSQTPNVTAMKATQHVCCDVKSPREAVEKMTITRSCEAKYTPYSALAIFVNGTLVHTEPSSSVSPSLPGASYTHTLAQGDEVVIIHYSGVPGLDDAVCLVEYSGYNTDDKDTDTLVFPGYVEGANGQLLEVPRYSYTGEKCDGNSGRVRLSWSYMDYWWCIGNMTMREFVNAMCHIKGQPVLSTGTAVGFGAASAANLGDEGDVVSIRPSSQAVGAVTRLEYNDHSERSPQELRFVGDFIPENITIYKSIFYGANARPTGVAEVPMFEAEDTATYGYTWEDCGAVMLEEIQYTQGGGTYYGLSPLPDMQWMGIDSLTDTIEADIETYTDLRGYTYCYCEGRKYILIEADADTDTGLCNATGLLVI